MQEDWRLEIEQVLHGLRMKEKVFKFEILLNMNDKKYNNKINIIIIICASMACLLLFISI